MNDFRIPFGAWISDAIDWFKDVFQAPFDILTSVSKSLYDGFSFLLTEPPFWVILIIFAAIAWLANGWKLALGTLLGLLFILSVNQWENAMNTLVLVILASIASLIIAIPLGIWAARSSAASASIRPVLDFLQTMPGFVYLVPALMMFGIGVVPGLAATVIFSLAPGVRLTELGIRGVDEEVVEAGYSFGATSGRILRQIQLPLAMPSIMAGVNQVIMLSLSMVVLAGMVGAGGLGAEVVKALGRIDIALGFEAGLAVVFLAMILDRITGAFGAKRSRAKRMKRA